MKALQYLNNVERAKLLFDLHPAEIAAFNLYAKDTLKQVLTDDSLAKLANGWQNGLMTVEYWIGLLEDVQATYIKYGTQLSKSKNLFSDQLFDGLKALVMSTLLANYTKTQDNKKFNQTINLLFS